MLSRQEEKELLGLGKELLLTDFPNPERLGCPGMDALRTLALRSQSLPLAERNRLLDHMTCCSPCFSEFSAFVDQARRRKRLAVIGLCAILLVTIGFAAWLAVSQWRSKPGDSITRKPPSTERPGPERKPQDQKAPEPGPQEPRPEIARQQPQPRIYRNVILDVRDQSVARGESPRPPERKYPKIPRGLLDLSIYLPFGSEAGKYHLTIYKDPAKPLLSTTGIARIRQGTTIVRIKLDTSQMSPGAYILESRQADWTSGYTYRFLVAE
jgi:hypothetical protein